MSVREPVSLSRATGAQLVVDHLWISWNLMTKKKAPGAYVGVDQRALDPEPYTCNLKPWHLTL